MQGAIANIIQTDVKKFKQECIPFYLETKLEGFKVCKLTEEGYLISLYSGVGTVLVNRYNEKECFRFENRSPILRFRFRFPSFLTLHENGVLQIIKDIRFYFFKHSATL